MTKTELIDRVSEMTELTKKDTTRIVDAIFDSIMDALKTGDKVQLIGFGSFEVRDRPERTGRNPQTGAEIRIAAKKAPVFKAGKALKDSVEK